jgi:hypothetical protein
MYELPITLIVAGLSLAGVLNTVQGQQEEQWITYENATLGIKISHPESWEVTEVDTGIAFWPPVGDVFTFFTLNTTKLEPGYETSARAELRREVDQHRRVGAEILETGSMTLGGLPAEMAVHRNTLFGNDLYTTTDIKAIGNGTLYDVHYSTESFDYETLWPIYERMTQSIEIAGVAKTGDGSFT